MKILENELLAPYTTFKIGGRARFFCVVQTVLELAEATAFASQKNIPFFIVGGGSNLLVSDKGFQGLIIKMEIRGVSFGTSSQENETTSVLVTVGAGENWDRLVAETVEKGLWGLENLSLIPGTVGASPVQNIGAYGVEVGDCIESVTVFDATDRSERTFTHAECQFGYRKSVFKQSEFKKYSITAVTFRLSTKPNPRLEYKDLKEFFTLHHNAHPSQAEIRNAVIAIRTGKFPDLSEIGTAGSFWKNPFISKEHVEKLKTLFPLLPSFAADGDNVKVPLAYILDAVCGLKGFTQGRVGLFKKQPLVLVAEKGATATEVNQLADEVARIVKEKTDISIEREVERLPLD